MKDQRYSLIELRAMTHKQLEAIAPAHVKITKNVNKTDSIKLIMRAYSDLDLEAGEPTVDLPATESTGQSNAEFERLAGGGDVDEPYKENRGGARPGSGRPKGMTNKKSRLTHLPQQPNELILLSVSAAFELWAAKSQVPEVALTKEEAVELALPLTQLGEFYGVTRYLPEETMLWVAPVWAAHNIFKVKRQCIIEAKGIATDGQTGNHTNDLREAGLGQDDQGPAVIPIDSTHPVL